jgi:hypothetical protein
MTNNKIREALQKFWDAGCGNSTDFRIQGEAFDLARPILSSASEVQEGWIDQLEQIKVDLLSGPYPAVALAVARVDQLLPAAPQGEKHPQSVHVAGGKGEEPPERQA